MTQDHFKNKPDRALKAAILICSDRAHSGEYEDKTTAILLETFQSCGYEVCATDIVPDEEDRIATRLIAMCSEADFVIVSGGTGPMPRDVTPEATRRIIDKELPGITEMLRAKSLEKTPYAVGSRAICGIRNQSIILNVPGSPKAAQECLQWSEAGIRHILNLICSV